MAFVFAVLAFHGGRGLPPRRLLLPILGVASILPLVLRVVLPALWASGAG